jgi:nicotinamidase-related amidase
MNPSSPLAARELDTPALVLIDMQRGLEEPRLGPRNNPGAEARIAELLALFRARSFHVVHVRHVSREAGSVFAPGQVGACFQPAFEPRPTEAVLEKHTPDAFVHTGLQRWLHDRGVRRLVIVGAASQISVEATARSGGNLGFSVWVAHDACFTFDRSDFSGARRSADEVHAMAMANLHGEYATVLATAELRARLQAEPAPRKLISSGSSYEQAWGYSRALVDGDTIYVSGTTGFDYRTMSIDPEPERQARQALANISTALQEAGATLADVVRVHHYVTDAAYWPAVGAVAGELFAQVRPAATAIVCGLVDPRMKVEIEVTARHQLAHLGAQG